MHLKVGDIVRVGGITKPDTRAKNAGRFRTITGILPAGTELNGPRIPIFMEGYVIPAAMAELDGTLLLKLVVNPLSISTIWAESPVFDLRGLVKVDPGNGEDEILTRVGKPEDQLIKA